MESWSINTSANANALPRKDRISALETTFLFINPSPGLMLEALLGYMHGILFFDYSQDGVLTTTWGWAWTTPGHPCRGPGLQHLLPALGSVKAEE